MVWVKRHHFPEAAAFITLLILGLTPRLAFIHSFPTLPTSDFEALVLWGLAIRDHGFSSDGYFWMYSPGTPIVLSGLFRLFPHLDPATVGRVATALMTGLLPMLPFLVWRGVLPLWVRFLGGAGFALWPGQVLFSGVIAQDNWVLLPVMALAALAVRAQVSQKPANLALTSFLYGFGALTRQEMPLVLFPLFLAASIVSRRLQWQRIAALSVAAVLPLLAVAGYRYAATGRFALGQETAGTVILGSYIPGAGSYRIEPLPFIASERPELLRAGNGPLNQGALRLAVREAYRRPFYQAARILAANVAVATNGDAGSMYWSLTADSVLPQPLRPRGRAFADRVTRPLIFELTAIQGLFFGAVIVGIMRRNPSILALTATVLLKYGVHAFIYTFNRYFIPATALEILAIVLAAYELWKIPRPKAMRLTVQTLAAGTAFGIALLLLTPRLEAFVRRIDIDTQRTYRFSLKTENHDAELTCQVSRGVLTELVHYRYGDGIAEIATLRPFLADPKPGDLAVASCELTSARSAHPVTLQVLDPYEPGGLRDRIVQRVEVDGQQVFCHDIAGERGSGWADISVGGLGSETRRKVVIEVRALNPDPGSKWGEAAKTSFRISSSRK